MRPEASLAELPIPNSPELPFAQLSQQPVDELVPSELTFPDRLRQSRVARTVLGLATATGLLTAITAIESSPASADESLVYTVQDTETGVFARHSPHQNDTDRIVGQGAYDGDRIQLICGVTNGDPVGQYSNRTWHKVKDLTNGQGPFWINDHWTNTPVKAASHELVPGEVGCNGGATQGPTVERNPAPNPSKFVGGCKSNLAASLLSSSQNGIEGWSWSQGWAQEWGNESSDDICVGATFADPDHANHRQYVGTVESKVPDLEPTGCSDAYMVEIWGDGFYKKTNCIKPTQWSINKWLKGGTYLCAARSSAYDTGAYNSDAEAAAAVRSGRAPIGEDDPHRAVACIAIKA